MTHNGRYVMHRKLKYEKPEIYLGDLGVYQRIVLQCIKESNVIGWFHLARDYVRRRTLYLSPRLNSRPHDRRKSSRATALSQAFSCIVVLSFKKSREHH
jgi:hypothetical protein